MSASQGPRESSRDSRGRGRVRARGAFQSRDMRGDGRARHIFRQPPTAPASASASPQSSRSQASKQNSIRTSSPRNGGTLSSTPRGRGQTLARSAPSITSGSRKETWHNPLREPTGSYQKHMGDLFETLQKKRKVERTDAIRNGFLANPDRPTSLAHAITPVGTCQDMCSEYERVERIVQSMVDGCEKTTAESGNRLPCEEHMVKRFRRSAAGDDQQLPSDIRPPAVLQKTLNYLFDKVVGGSQPLATIHKFVWDRTRGIRNDFSIQQVTKAADIRIATDCFERIARFHILSLHQLSVPGIETGEFNPHQEREQLNNTLLSLMYYYDDNRHKMGFPNEAEFRAYCILFEIQSRGPDLEDRAQQWPRELLRDRRVQTALKLYAAAGNTSDEQGPLKPPAPFSIAQANTGRFWASVKSNTVSYLMACVAEIYFGIVRKTALENIWKAYKGKRSGPTKIEDWVLDDLKTALGFDDEEQTQAFCEDHGFTVAEKESGEAYVDLGTVTSGYLEDTNPRRKQIFSRNLVEHKRLGRTFPAVINGLSASQAKSQGLVYDSAAETSSVSDQEPLFVEDLDEEQANARSRSATPDQNDEIQNNSTELNPSASPFTPTPNLCGFPTPSRPSLSSGSIFGMPTPPTSTTSTTDPLSIFNPGAVETRKPDPFGTRQTPNFFQGTNDRSILSTTNEPTAQQKDIFKQPPSLFAGQPPLSFGIPPLFGDKDKIKDSNGDTQDASKDITSKPADSLFSTSKAKDTSSTTPASTLFQSSTSSSTLFQPTPTTSSPFPNPSSTSLFPPPKTTFAYNEPPSTETSYPFSKFLPATGKPMFTTQGDFSKPAPPNIDPCSFKPTTADTSSTSTTQSQPSFFPPSIAPVPQTAIYQPTTPFSPMDTSQSPVRAEPTTAPSALSPNAPRSPYTPTSSPAEQAKARPPRADPRPAALDNLSQAMMMDDEGLLSQFVEYTIGPVIAESFRQVKDERSWAKAREVRAVLLGRKYFKRWQANAWKKYLSRKGKERRKNFAQSMRELAQSTRNRPPDLNSSSQPIATSQDSRRREPESQGRNAMLPPSLPSQKRTSLPTDFGGRSQNSNQPENKKRKHHHSPPQADQATPRRHKNYHKRLSTASGLSMSHPPQKRIRSPEFPRIGYSTLADGTIIDEALMREARKLAPRAKTDTTNTDYFLLKSRGIDPDTPIVPKTMKRRSTTLSETPSETKLHKLIPPTPSNTPLHQPPPTTTTKPTTNPSDAALFASLAQVRSALAESIEWFQSERAKSESQSCANTPPPLPATETEKEKRLREFRFTPSRTEVRMRASGMGGVWDERKREEQCSTYGSPTPGVAEAWDQRNGMGMKTGGVPAWSTEGASVGMQRQAHLPGMFNPQTQNQPMGFAALATGNGDGVMRAGQKVENKGTGSSAEDAIEL